MQHDHGTTDRYDDGCRCPACIVAQTGRQIQAGRETMRRTLAELLETEIELGTGGIGSLIPVEPDPTEPTDPVSP